MSFESYAAVERVYSRLFDRSVLIRYLDSNLKLEDRFIFKSGYFKDIIYTTDTQYSLSDDQIEMVRNS